jgi:hypothetical protein
MKFDIPVFFENLLRKCQFHENLTRITGILHADQFIFLVISHRILVRMRNFSGSRREDNTHFMLNNIFVFELFVK